MADCVAISTEITRDNSPPGSAQQWHARASQWLETAGRRWWSSTQVAACCSRIRVSRSTFHRVELGLLHSCCMPLMMTLRRPCRETIVAQQPRTRCHRVAAVGRLGFRVTDMSTGGAHGPGALPGSELNAVGQEKIAKTGSMRAFREYGSLPMRKRQALGSRWTLLVRLPPNDTCRVECIGSAHRR